MSEAETVQALERSLRERAEKLAEECLAVAREKRSRIRQEQSERLRERERKEEQRAGDEAERRRRRRVEAVRHEQHGALEQRRWQAIQEVIAEMRGEFAAIADDESRYLEQMRQLLAAGAGALPDGPLILQVNARDRERLMANWDALVGEAMRGRQISLSDEAAECTGGVVVYTEDNRTRLDNTFEGRLERHAGSVARLIDEALFAETAEAEREPSWEGS